MANFNLNKVILGGRISQDLELKQTPSGVYALTFSIAVNRKTGKEQEQQADFINCVAWRNTAEFISRYFNKGSSICIVGEIQTRSWTDGNGNKRYATEVIVSEAYFVDGKGEQAQEKQAPELQTPQAPKFEEISNNDDLPF
jgi:single-strand DNA-binding protein